MSRITITFDEGEFERVRAHLLPTDRNCEEAAFLFTRINDSPESLTLHVEEMMLIPPTGFASRSQFYLELTDEARAAVIDRAYELGAGLIECHSHPGQIGARFSWSDLHGFDEFVPHVRWRLSDRAYVAIVFATDSFDALAWVREGPAAVPIKSILAGERPLEPTQFTLANWSSIRECSPL